MTILQKIIFDLCKRTKHCMVKEVKHNWIYGSFSTGKCSIATFTSKAMILALVKVLKQR